MSHIPYLKENGVFIGNRRNINQAENAGYQMKSPAKFL